MNAISQKLIAGTVATIAAAISTPMGIVLLSREGVRNVYPNFVKTSQTYQQAREAFNKSGLAGAKPILETLGAGEECLAKSSTSSEVSYRDEPGASTAVTQVRFDSKTLKECIDHNAKPPEPLSQMLAKSDHAVMTRPLLRVMYGMCALMAGSVAMQAFPRRRKSNLPPTQPIALG